MLFRKKEQLELSKWYTIDSIFCAVVLFFYPLTFFMYEYMYRMWYAAILFVIVQFFARKLYCTDRSYPQFMKNVEVIVRSVVYTAVVLGAILPFTMCKDWTWYYPVQRAVYLSNYSDGCFLEDFLPKTVPLDAKDYQVTFLPKLMQGEAVVRISFYTDSENLAEYTAYAEAQNKKHYKIESVASEDGANYLIEDNKDYNGAVVYEFDGPYTPIYIINEKTGYIRIYY